MKFIVIEKGVLSFSEPNFCGIFGNCRSKIL